MKKRILLLAAVAVCVATMMPGTLAYFTQEDTAHNVITADGIDMEIVEWTLEDGKLVPYPQDEPIEVMPGITVSKIVTIANKDAEAYIRASFDMTVKNAAGEVMQIDETTLKSIIQIAPNSEFWLSKDTGDGWYYYKDAVDTDKTTQPLFSEVVFSGVNMTNEYQNCTVEIDVYAQAVQTANNGTGVLEAAGWPKN